MTMAAAIEGRTAEAKAWAQPIRIASVDIIHDLGAAEAIWRSCENPEVSYTPYQRFDFLAAWQRQVGEREGLSPFIVVAYDGDRRPLLLLPLATKTVFGMRGASFMGGKHATFNMALYEKDFAAKATRADLATLVSALSNQSRADVLALHRQPMRWRELPNPM